METDTTTDPETATDSPDVAGCPAPICCASCPDCGAEPGEIHGDGCDVERCSECGGQVISCDCEGEYSNYPPIPWSGEWPGKDACREHGFWCYWGPPWIRCKKDHPAATEDLNSLVEECDWNPETQKWEIRKHNTQTMAGEALPSVPGSGLL